MKKIIIIGREIKRIYSEPPNFDIEKMFPHIHSNTEYMNTQQYRNE